MCETDVPADGITAAVCPDGDFGVSRSMAAIEQAEYLPRLMLCLRDSHVKRISLVRRDLFIVARYRDRPTDETTFRICGCSKTSPSGLN